jgi:subtilisin family serine protease
MNPILLQQIERILDEDASRTLSVIVQAVQPGRAEAARSAAKGILETRSITRASALLPGRPGVSTNQASRQSPDKLTALRRAGSQALSAIEKSGFLASSRLARRSDVQGKPRLMQFASAAVLEIDRDDLALLASELPAAVAVYPNRRIALPPRMRAVDVPLQVSRKTTHAWGLEKSGALACWGSFGAQGQGVKVAVLDTGVEASHPDLAGKIARFAEFDSKGNVSRTGVANARDEGGHGTHVCGTIAGGRESGRWIGMASQCKLLVAKVLGKSGGTDEQFSPASNGR